MAEEKQEGQKTVVSFVVGLLIGGLLVWAFSGPNPSTDPAEKTEEVETTEQTDDNKTTESDTEEPESTPVASSPTPKPAQPATLSVGEGKIVVSDQPASDSIKLTSATYPVSDGWIGVREYAEGHLGSILGVVRFSEAQGLVPENIILQRATTAGREYAVVIFTESGDRQFNSADDVQLDTIFATFKAQ